MPVDQEKIAKLRSAARTGGKGQPRRKQRPAPQRVAAADPKLQGHLKRLNIQDIPGVEEANFFDETGADRILHFTKPKVQANPNANTYVISGRPEEKSMSELLPDVLYQLGPKQFEQIKAVAEQAGVKTGETEDVPPLETENFEQYAQEQEKTVEEETKDEEPSKEE
ncbi:hypothetical protein P9112_006716 [Eukaryota sp. TZLM1-RC]